MVLQRYEDAQEGPWQVVYDSRMISTSEYTAVIFPASYEYPDGERIEWEFLQENSDMYSHTLTEQVLVLKIDGSRYLFMLTERGK